MVNICSGKIKERHRYLIEELVAAGEKLGGLKGGLRFREARTTATASTELTKPPSIQRVGHGDLL